jgi:hypothetical protein
MNLTDRFRRQPTIAGVKSHIYSYGHRNPQGLVFAPDGRLYESEHGPNTDDEVNLIRAGGNYGWPHIAGYRDDQSYAYANWSASKGVPCGSLTYTAYPAGAAVGSSAEGERVEPSRLHAANPDLSHGADRIRLQEPEMRGARAVLSVLADRSRRRVSRSTPRRTASPAGTTRC